jgi:hypothetical protein
MQDSEYCLLRAHEARVMAAIAEPSMAGRYLRIADRWERTAKDADAAPDTDDGMPEIVPKRSRRVWAVQYVDVAGGLTKIWKRIYRRVV